MRQERDIVRQHFRVLNEGLRRAFGVQLDVIDWENHSVPGIAEGSSQRLLVNQLLEPYRDSLVLFIGLMGDRFGTDTGDFGSGTEHEYSWAIDRHQKVGFPEIMFFFRQPAPLDPGSRTLDDDLGQIREVQSFMKRLQDACSPSYYVQFGASGDRDGTDRFYRELLRVLSLWLYSVDRPWMTADKMSGMPQSFVSPEVRTQNIVATAQKFLETDLPKDFTIRISSMLSSFAVTDTDFWKRDPKYIASINRERELLTDLFHRGANLRVLVNWSIGEICDWQPESRRNVLARLEQLGEFLGTIMQKNKLIKRALFVHSHIRDRNLMFFGTDFLYEGRRLNSAPGIDATKLYTDDDTIQSEVAAFESVLQDALKHTNVDANASQSDFNRQLAERLRHRIEGDIRRLKRSLPTRKKKAPAKKRRS